MINNRLNIHLSHKTIEFIKKILTQNNLSIDLGLRIYASGEIGGIINYSLGFDPVVKENDTLITISGIKLIIDEKSSELLAGTAIDYIENDEKSGFVFNNPNQTKTCGGCSCHK